MKDLIPKETLSSNLLEHSAVAAWSELAPEKFQPSRIEVLRRAAKSAIYRLEGSGPGGSNVIAKRCLSATAAIEWVIYRDILVLLPLPALECYGIISDEDPNFSWLFIADAGREPYVKELPAHREALAEWLVELHSLELQASLTDHLPARGPDHYLGVLANARSLLQSQFINPFLRPADISLLQQLIVQCDFLEENWTAIEQVCRSARPVLVHGDLVLKNVRVKLADTRLTFLAFDWENAGWGPPAADLASFPDRTVNPDLELYSAGMRTKSGPNPDELAACGKIFRLLDSIRWAASWLVWKPYNDWLSKPMAFLQVYQQRLVQAFSERGLNFQHDYRS